MLKNQKTGLDPTMYSSFTIVERMLAEIIPKLMSNQRLMKLLYYTDKHALSGPDLTQEQIYDMLNERILIVPNVEQRDILSPTVVIGFDKFIPQNGVTAFRGVSIYIDILCPYDCWILDDFKLRPFAIAGEIDVLLNKSTVLQTGIAEFVQAEALLHTSEVGGVNLLYFIETNKDDIQFHPE